MRSRLFPRPEPVVEGLHSDGGASKNPLLGVRRPCAPGVMLKVRQVWLPTSP